MYVSPFWSYRDVGGQHLVTNRLTKEQRLVDRGLVEMLGRVDAGDASVEPDFATEARALQLLFDSAEAAEERFAALEADWMREVPVVDQIEMTNRCPYTCQMCPRTLEMDRPLGDMTMELFERIVAQIAGRQEYVALHHFGESLVHPQLADAVAFARGRGLRCGLSCNPPTLTPARSAALLSAGIANLVLSLDSLNADTYRAIRGQAAHFGRADANLRELVRLRDAGGHDAWITAQMISMSANDGEAEAFLDYCRDVGVDRGVVIRMGRWDFDDETVAKLGQFTTPGYDGYCSRIWTSVVVLWDGRVVPCCHDYNGAVVIGDLAAMTVEEMWSSAAAKRFRAENGESALCRSCAFSKGYRIQQRREEGFARFHREREPNRRSEWLNPASLHRDGRRLFSGFDVLTE